VMLKATAGGEQGASAGEEESELSSSLRMAKSEAKSAFSDDSVYIEKYIENPATWRFRSSGPARELRNLCERECSIQRATRRWSRSPPPSSSPPKSGAMGKWRSSGAGGQVRGAERASSSWTGTGTSSSSR